jgi:alpha-tubulin suppressor-like RCC1 family protein
MTRRKNHGLYHGMTTLACVLALGTVLTAQDNAKWQTAMQQAASARQNGQLEEYEKLVTTALEEAEKFGPSNQRLLVTLDALGTYYLTKGAYISALPIYTRKLEIREHVLGANHPLVADALSHVAFIESILKKPAEAEAHGERALNISEQAAAGFSGITAVAAGGNHSCAIVGRGQVHCWGSNLNGQLGVPSPSFTSYPVELAGVNNAVALAAGASFTCALLADHTVTCWGENTSGQTGVVASPTAGPNGVAGLTGARGIAAGSDHACALLDGGAVKCWGSNQNGQLGNGTVADSPTPVQVSGIKGAKAIAAGSAHSCAAADGGATCWGVFLTGSEPMVSPVRVAGFTGNITSLVAGSNYACALLADASVSCWRGIKAPAPGSTAPASAFTAPEAIKGLGPVQSLAAGYAHTCALLTDGSARCWGNNREGQLGDGQTVNSPNPVTVKGLAAATAITAGLAHTCAVLADKTAQCWGTDSYGAPPDLVFGLRSHVPIRVGRDESMLISTLNLLADVYRSDGKFDKAEPLYLRTLQLLEKARGPENESLVPTLKGYAEMLRKAGRADDAAKIEARVQSISFKPTLTDVPTAPPRAPQ